MTPNTRSISKLTRRQFAWQAAAAVALQGLPALGATVAHSARHRILCCDYEGNKIAIVAEDGKELLETHPHTQAMPSTTIHGRVTAAGAHK